MMKADLHQLVDALPEEAVEAAGSLLKRLSRGEVDLDQTWVWTPEWQEQLRSSLSDLAAGRTRRFGSGDEFLAAL